MFGAWGLLSMGPGLGRIVTQGKSGSASELSREGHSKKREELVQGLRGAAHCPAGLPFPFPRLSQEGPQSPNVYNNDSISINNNNSLQVVNAHYVSGLMLGPRLRSLM